MAFKTTPLKDMLGDKGYIRGPFGSALKRGELKNSGIPVYEQQHAIHGIRNFRFYVDDDKYQELKRFTTKPCDLIISCSGTVGRVSVIQETDPIGIISQALLILRPDTQVVLPQYLYYFLVSKKGQAELLNASQGAVQLNIAPRAVVERIPVPLPDLIEQARIVSILGSIDDKIELNRQINQTLEQIAQTIFKSWFVDFEPVKVKITAKAAGRDPERAIMCAISGNTDTELDQLTEEQRQQLAVTAALFPDKMVESELGLIPRKWSAKPLYNTAKFINGASFKAKDFSLKKDGLPIVKIAELKSGIAEQTKFTTGKFPVKYKITNDDILYSWSGSPKTSLEVFKWFWGEGWLNQHIFKVVTDSTYSKYYVFFLLRQLKPELIAIATDKQTTGLGHVTVADMKRLLVPYPNKEILLRFASVVGPLYEESSCIEKQSISLIENRDALLPKLLLGELPLAITVGGGNE